MQAFPVALTLIVVASVLAATPLMQSSAASYAAGSFGIASVNSSIIRVSGTERQAFAGWSGDATGSSGALSNPIAMDGPKTAQATWTVLYLVRVDSNIQIQIDESGLYYVGTQATLRATQQVAYGCI